MFAGLVLIKADGAHHLIEAVGVVIAPLFLIFLNILYCGLANIAQSLTQTGRLGRGIAIIVVMVVHIIGTIFCCNVMQTSATNLLVVIIIEIDKFSLICWMQQVGFVPQFHLLIITAQIEGGGR
jgi:hypothetical protein